MSLKFAARAARLSGKSVTFTRQGRSFTVRPNGRLTIAQGISLSKNL